MIPDVSKDGVAVIFSVTWKIKATELLEISITLKKKDCDRSKRLEPLSQEAEKLGL
jgi:hypothetical protein